MTIHYTKLKQAAQMGCHLSSLDRHNYRIFWPKRSVELIASTPDTAISEMQAIQEILKNSKYRVVMDGKGPLIRLINFESNKEMVGCPEWPSVILSLLEDKVSKWVKITDKPMQAKEEDNTINGTPRNGAAAYKLGVPALDCPFMEDDPDFVRWNNEWDAAADQIIEKEEKHVVQGKGSVITNHYRAAYAEKGHPSHCGDALAVFLNEMCANKGGTNMEVFEAICAANQVDLSKYNRTTKGWQGRIRMTGRNLLAKRVHGNHGRVLLPEWMGREYHQLDEEWLSVASSKFRPKEPF